MTSEIVRGSGGASETAPGHNNPIEISIPRRWLRTPEAAEYLGASVPHITRLRERGRGPRYRKWGHIVLYDIAELDAYIEGMPVKGGGK